jgi:hypothetical protein
MGGAGPRRVILNSRPRSSAGTGPCHSSGLPGFLASLPSEGGSWLCAQSPCKMRTEPNCLLIAALALNETLD